MLKFILGPGKSGKTKYTRDYLSQLAREGRQKLLMLVPDQMTFETEKAFLNDLGPTLSASVQVMGFSRLCDYVFEKSGYIPKTLASDCVKTLLMSVALEETSHALKVYSDSYNRANVINMMLSTRYELIRNKSDIAQIDDGDLTENLRDKLHDVKIVLGAYDALLGSSFEDPDGELSVCYDLLLENKLFEDYVICVDSFLSFPQLELDILELLMAMCSEMLVTFPDDCKSTPDSIFTVSRESQSKVRLSARKNTIKELPTQYCTYKGFFENPELSLVEENAFRGIFADDELETFDEIPQSIVLDYSKDIFDEVDFVAKNIKRLVMEEGYKYKDIAIICRDLAPYRTVLNNTLNNYEVPHFMDSPKNVLSSPLMKLVVSVFECVNNGYQNDSVINLLKSGLLPISDVDASLFENYLFTWSFSGKKLLKPFTDSPEGFDFRENTENDETLKRIEGVRKFLLEPLEMFANSVKDATALEISRALYNLMLTYKVPDTIDLLATNLTSRGEHRLSEEQLRLWDAFIETLDNTVDIIGSRKISPKTYCELLKLEFLSLDLAFIPKAVDEVTVGDIERLRLSDKKAVFIMGAVKGTFPRVGTSGGLFTSAERQALTDLGLLSEASVELEYTRERYHCYYALTSASEKLFVSFPTREVNSRENQKSEIFDEIFRLFPKLAERMENFSKLEDTIDDVWAKKPSFSLYSRRFGGSDDLTLALCDYYSHSEEYLGSVEALNRAYTREPMTIKDRAISEKLYGKDLYLSPTRVEKFHMCKFSYFCQYGLGLKERRKAELNVMEYGSYIHYILENFVKSHSKDELTALTEDDIDREITHIMQSYIESKLGNIEDKSKRLLYLFTRVRESVKKLLIHLIDELSQSKFTPDAFELEIGKDVPAYTLNLPTGDKVIIKGKVDRADIYEHDGKKYIRIVDYKTGTKVFRLSDVLYGLNLQMLIYLSVITGSKEGRYADGVIPAGILYSPAVVPTVEAEKYQSSDEVKANIYKQIRCNGLLLRDEDVLSAMEKEMLGVFLPVSFKEDGVKSGADALATLEDFGAIFSKIDSIIGKMALELKDGVLDAVPTVGTYDACKYCPYHSICNHREGDRENNVFRLDRDEIMTELYSDRKEDESCAEMD
ncbi:MAG: PD-(D/E)XK nuclease family protein [Eubacteriales bacterium]|nr:PD-(D/E)XK nuclease family protein [Eubacteriales bacterium]